MPSLRDPSLLRSVKGKVVIGFLIAALALAASWTISKVAFDNMLNRLNVISEPSEKLQLVNSVFKSILHLDQLQNERVVKGDPAEQQFLAQSSQLVAYIDTLSLLCIDDPVQVIRLDSMKRILRERAKTYADYIRVRSKLVSNRALSDEVKSISGLIKTNQLKPDSTVVKTEKRTTTTTTYTEAPDPSPNVSEAEKKGFLNRVFGSKKSKQPSPVQPAKIVQRQEVNVQVDTLKVTKENHAIQHVDEAVKAIEASQKIRTSKFVDQEQELAAAGNSLVRQLTRVMQDVERDVITQTNEDGAKAQKIVAQSVNGLEYIMLAFFFLIALMAYLIFADISKSNQYRSQLEEARDEAEYHSMAKQRFLSNMSHEIRTPLQSIIGYTEALKTAKKINPQDLHTLHAASEHLLYLVNDILDYSRIVSNQFTFEDRAFAVSPLLIEVIEMLRPSTSGKSLTLTLNDSLADGLYLTGDPFRLRQVLYNLLTNAIKFTEKGEVALTANGSKTKRGFKLELKISDSGIGLSEEQIHRVFNQFEQADASTARQYGGTGLGLSIVKSLVERMSGTIQVQSKPDKGTTFLVSVLLPEAEAPAPALELSEPLTDSFKGRVWLIDDDAFILKWCSSVLQAHQIPHRTFSSGEEALDHPWENDVTLVLTDMRMPGISGAEVCARLRQTVPEHVKFYVLTAQALPEEKVILMNLGFDGILMKPFRAHDLLNLIKEKSTKSLSKIDEDLHFTAVSEMTFGDETLLREILDQFVKDMKSDLQTLKTAVDQNQLISATEIIHKLAGRTGQMGIKSLSEKLRNTEISLRETTSGVSKEDLVTLITETGQIVDLVEEKVLSYSI
jgi:signal transduction histidine kinase/DNA-binding response OmpR family regulator